MTILGWTQRWSQQRNSSVHACIMWQVPTKHVFIEEYGKLSVINAYHFTFPGATVHILHRNFNILPWFCSSVTEMPTILQSTLFLKIGKLAKFFPHLAAHLKLNWVPKLISERLGKTLCRNCYFPASKSIQMNKLRENWITYTNFSSISLTAFSSSDIFFSNLLLSVCSFWNTTVSF